MTTLSLPETPPTENNNLVRDSTSGSGGGIEISKQQRQKNDKEQNGIQGPLYDVIGSKKSQNRQNYFAASSAMSMTTTTCQSLITETITLAAGFVVLMQLLLMTTLS